MDFDQIFYKKKLAGTLDAGGATFGLFRPTPTRGGGEEPKKTNQSLRKKPNQSVDTPSATV